MKEDERRCAAMIIARWKRKTLLFFFFPFVFSACFAATGSGVQFRAFGPSNKNTTESAAATRKKQQQQQEELLSEAECNLQSSSASIKSWWTFFSLGELANSGLVLQSFSYFWVFFWLMQYCAGCDDSERAESWAWKVGVVGWLGLCSLAAGFLSSSPSPFLSWQKKKSLIYTYIERPCRRRHQQASWMFSLRTSRGCFTRTWVAWQEYSRSLIVILPSLPNAIAPDAIPICMVCPPTSYVCLSVCLSVTHSDRIPQKSSLWQNGKCGCVWARDSTVEQKTDLCEFFFSSLFEPAQIMPTASGKPYHELRSNPAYDMVIILSLFSRWPSSSSSGSCLCKCFCISLLWKQAIYQATKQVRRSLELFP